MFILKLAHEIAVKTALLLILVGCSSFAGLTSFIEGPSMLKGSLGETLCVKCRYEKYYHDFKKYWCKGSNWNYCEEVIKTDSTEEEKRVGRTVIKDNQNQFEFTVKMENITKEDAGIYWCAIEKNFADFKWEVNIMITIGGHSNLWGNNVPERGSHHREDPSSGSRQVYLPQGWDPQHSMPPRFDWADVTGKRRSLR
uniref:Ig-like domain-containing protein n=1 Tax=Laticauda laticaudata TaxID=8630 RepID=A0A8C5WXZ0_LATLA